MGSADHLHKNAADAALSGTDDASSTAASVHVVWDEQPSSDLGAPSVSALVGAGDPVDRRRLRGLSARNRAQATSPSVTSVDVAGTRAQSPSASPRFAALALLLLGGLAIAAMVSSTTDQEELAAPTTVSPTTTVAPSTTLSRPPQLALPNAPAAPTTWTQDRHLAFVGAQPQKWHVVDLNTAAELRTQGYFDFLIPPLDPNAVLVNLPNQSYAIDPADPAGSGQLSNAVSLGRISATSNDFSFVQITDEGATRITVNSLWAPTDGQPIEAPRDSTILVVDRRGVIISQSNGDSFVVGDNAEVRFVPITIGTVFAATPDWIVGRRCANGACDATIANWDFEIAKTISLDLLSSTSTLSPDGRWLASYLTNGQIEIVDIEAAAAGYPDDKLGRRFVRAFPESELIWSLDSTLLTWFSEGAFVASDVSEEALRVRTVWNGKDIVAGSPFFVS